MAKPPHMIIERTNGVYGAISVVRSMANRADERKPMKERRI
jgi:hypothetical protein